MSTTLVRVVLVLTLLAPAPSAVAADLGDLVDEYRALKTERQEALRSSSQRGRGQGRAKPPALEPALRKIAAVGSNASFRFLVKESSDRDPYAASSAVLALLSTGDKRAVGVAIKAYERGRKWTASARMRVLDALAESKDKHGPEFVLRIAAKGRDTSTRALALGSLGGRSQDEKALEVLLDALRQRAPQIRVAALRALKDYRFKTMIEPLIERIGREKEERLRVETLQFLVDLTGVNMGLEMSDWRKWWEISEARFEFGAEEAGSTKVVTHDLKYFGIEISSKRIAFLVDASNSMLRGVNERGKRRGGGGGEGEGGGGERKIDVLKKELTRILEELPDETQVDIIFFHRAPVPWKEELQALRKKGRAEAIEFVKNLECAFATNIYDTLELALADDRVDTLYLLSDGRPVGGKYDQPADILREITALNRIRGARIHCISFGRETDFLKELAKQNGGVYRATNPAPKSGQRRGRAR